MISTDRIVAAGLAFAFAVMLNAQTPLTKNFHDQRTGLIIHYPHQWELDRDSQVFTIVSFRPKNRPRMVLVPQNGAEIVLMSPPAGVMSVKDWLRLDRTDQDGDASITETMLSTAHYGDVPATFVQKELKVFETGWSREYFFHVEGRLFKARLFFRGNTRANEFEAILLAIIKGLETAR